MREVGRPPTSHPIRVELIDQVAPLAEHLVGARARHLAHVRYAEVRVEVAESRHGLGEGGAPRAAGDDAALTVGVRVLAGERAIAPGHAGSRLGAGDASHLPQVLDDTLAAAYRRAHASAAHKAEARGKYGPLGEALADSRLYAVPAHRARIPAVFAVDPRSVSPADMVSFAAGVSRQVRSVSSRIVHDSVSVFTRLSRELFASSEGALIDQSFALTQGSCFAVAAGPHGNQELWDVVGHQRGWEILAGGVGEPLMPFPPFAEFACALAREAVELADAPALPSTDGPVTVVTDPHYNTLLAHEIIGHPVELDRGLKMETAYAGRSWLLRDLDRHHLGRPVASPLVTAYSDPALPGYGHYAYDHEGTPARRVNHIEAGIFTGFLNSRQTAALFGGAPNGHWKATEASLVPLVRMSTTVFAAGPSDPKDILGEVDHGYYLVGHRIPSIAESRENFRISARRVYAIEGGQLGQLYRNGGIAADSRDYLMHVDAVGADFRLYPIPNCGKGQPMQTKPLGNGGPTMRSRARLTGGA
jgi:TldD protein